MNYVIRNNNFSFSGHWSLGNILRMRPNDVRRHDVQHSKRMDASVHVSNGKRSSESQKHFENKYVAPTGWYNGHL